jgi:phosphoglucosamine mutase
MVTTPLKQETKASKLPPSQLFGTDGIRGKAGDLLTADFALQLGLCAGEIFKQNNSQLAPVIVGQDSRNSSDMLASAIASGLTAAGIEVWNLGICPTPCVAHLTRTNQALGGIMISASHNPPEDNGIKFFGQGGTKISQTLTQAIENQLRKTYGLSHPTPVNNTWGKNYHRSYLIQDYLENLVETLQATSLPKHINFTGLKIVLDLAWGASVKLAPSVFEQLGAEVIALHDEPDGNKINVNCGSTHLESLKQAVKNHQADLGFAFDGDADRVMAVDSQGRVIDGDYILYLWGKHLQEQEQLPDNLLIGTVMANLGFERAWEKLGGKLIRTAVGDKYVQAEMWRTGAMLGGEQSGHILCHHHGVSGDGLQTALHLTALVSQSGISLSELVNQSFTTYPQILRNIRLNDRERLNSWQECEPLQKAIKEAEKCLGNDGRVLVRASGTEPLIRVMVEAIDSELTNYWTNKLTREVETHLIPFS